MNKITERIKNDKILNIIQENSLNAEIYLVGGAIRDFYLDKENFDKDIIVKTEDTKEYAKNLSRKLNATFVPLDEVNEIYRLVLRDKINFIDVAKLVGNSIEDDLKRRDFTINSIAVDLKNFEIKDVNNGLEDLKNKKIKSIYEQNFVDDSLRLLRAFRFEAVLGFELDENLFEIISKHALKINKCSVERINYEILRLFGGKYSAKSLIDMNKTKLMRVIFPITEDLKKVPPNSHHHLNLFFHSIETVNQIELLYENSSKEIQDHMEQIDFGGLSRLAHLKLAGFLHDIGKPQTWTIEEDTGKHRFIKHDDAGSKMASTILKSKKFSKKQIAYIKKMIKYHIYPSHVVSAPVLSEKVYMRFVRKMEEDAIDVILLAKADRLSARGEEITEEVVEKNLDALTKLLEFYLKAREALKPVPKLLSGNEIMKMLDIKPSPQLGEIIKQLKEAQLAGDVITKEDAINFVKNLN